MMAVLRAGVTALVCAAAAAPARAQPLDAAALIARVEAPQKEVKGDYDRLSIDELLTKLQVPGLSVAVVHNYQVHWAKGYGVADAKSGRPVDRATLFQAASISKPVTALAAMRLVQDRRLDLDADVNTILKSWKVPVAPFHRTQPVTPRALLSHTSGAVDGFGFDGYAPGAPLPTPVQILEGQKPANHGKVVFANAPYAVSKYSGGALILMQQALMDLSGQPFARFMHSTVLKPLDMSRSSFLQPPESERNVAFAHNKEGRRMEHPWHVHPELAPAGLWTTAEDLAVFIVEIQTALRGPRGKVLTRQAAREMTTPVGVGRYALGPAVDLQGQGWYFSHSGSNWGYRAFMSGHMRKGYGFVVMTNSDNGMAVMNQVADRITNAYQWDSAETPPSR